jgi:ParB-like chromosome segregation protein Spo0J
MSTTTEIDATKCIHNKFQPLSRIKFSDADLTDIDSIKTRGLDYPILVYKDPDVFDLYIVMDGWRRTSAWLRWRPGELIPAEIRPVPTDRELFETALITNEGRTNLNAIQKADLLAQGIVLGLTQAQAGRLFNPPIQQAAVSHLLSLRKLPDQIKAHVESGDIPERIARQLVTPAKYMELNTIEAAHAIANAKPENKETTAHVEINRLYHDRGKALSFEWVTPWKLDWPSTPLDAPDARPDKGEPTSVPACTDCPFNVEWNKKHFCMRPACHAVKFRIHNEIQKKSQAAQPSQPGRRQLSDWEIKEKARRKLLNLHNKQSRALVEAATPAIARILPAKPVMLDLLFDAVKFKMKESSREVEKKWKAADTDQRRAMITRVLITSKVGLSMWTDIPPAKAKATIQKLAQALQVKLPAGWDQPVRPARAPKKPGAPTKRAKRARK